MPISSCHPLLNHTSALYGCRGPEVHDLRISNIFLHCRPFADEPDGQDAKHAIELMPTL